MNTNTLDHNLIPFSRCLQRRCVEGEWTDNDVPCKPVNCKIPDVAYANANCPDGTTYGRECFFKCVQPAKLHGTVINITSKFPYEVKEQ